MFKIKLQAVQDKLTKNEQKIVKYIFDNMDDLNSLTSYEFANKLNIGQATAIRFAKKLGYTSFTDMANEIKNLSNQKLYESEINSTEETLVTNIKIKDQYTRILNLTSELNSSNDFETVIELISNAHSIVIFGIGNSATVASDFYSKLKMIDFNIFYSLDVHFSFSVISKLTSNDVLILISDSGETSEVLKAAELGKENLVPTIGITNFAKNKLNSYVNYILRTVNFDLDMDIRIDSTASRISQLFILDTLFINILKQDYTKYKSMIQINNTAVKKLK